MTSDERLITIRAAGMGKPAMDRRNKHHALEARLIDFGVQVCHIAEALPRTRIG